MKIDKPEIPEKDEMVKRGVPVALRAVWSESKDHLQIDIVNLLDKPLSVAEIIGTISAYTMQLITARVQGDFTIPWNNEVEKHQPPPAERHGGRYMGE